MKPTSTKSLFPDDALRLKQKYGGETRCIQVLKDQSPNCSHPDTNRCTNDPGGTRGRDVHGYLGRLFEQDKFEVIGRGFVGPTGSFFLHKATPDAIGQALAPSVRSINLGLRMFAADFTALPVILEMRDAV